MTNKEAMNQNIAMTFDFLKNVLKKPMLIESIVNGRVIEFVQKEKSMMENQGKKALKKYIKVRYEFETI